MSADVLITVVMGVYNQHNRRQLDEAVASILAQTMTAWELIICDDGSEGEAAGYLEEYRALDRRIRVLRHEENRGLAATLNACIGLARGKYVARMDADDRSKPDRFEKQYRFLEENPQYAFVGCNADLIDDNGTWGARRMPEKPERRDFLPFSPFIHPSVMVRLEAYRMSGGYYVSRETWRCEDYEFFMRLYAMGFSGYNMQESLFCYREDRESYEKRKFRYRVDEMKIRRRNFRNLGMNGPVAWLYTMRPVAAGLLPVRLLMYIKHRQFAGKAAEIESKSYEGSRLLLGKTAKTAGLQKPVEKDARTA